ncbi:MAG TPA: prevent-host-death protein [Acidobacteriota bacterium]|nr:prevent-host-death protein [Acidobacteriota bacterium]HNJ39540.1 prevent-host-death protein [Acidobacteriota bacterium]
MPEVQLNQVLYQAQQLSPQDQLELIKCVVASLSKAMGAKENVENLKGNSGMCDSTTGNEILSSPRIPGLHAGEVWMSEDFNEPLPDEFWMGNA